MTSLLHKTVAILTVKTPATNTVHLFHYFVSQERAHEYVLVHRQYSCRFPTNSTVYRVRSTTYFSPRAFRNNITYRSLSRDIL